MTNSRLQFHLLAIPLCWFALDLPAAEPAKDIDGAVTISPADPFKKWTSDPLSPGYSCLFTVNVVEVDPAKGGVYELVGAPKVILNEATEPPLSGHRATKTRPASLITGS